MWFFRFKTENLQEAAGKTSLGMSVGILSKPTDMLSTGGIWQTESLLTADEVSV